jgi:magnesium-transporting ATPase (P-type)
LTDGSIGALLLVAAALSGVVFFLSLFLAFMSKTRLARELAKDSQREWPMFRYMTKTLWRSLTGNTVVLVFLGVSLGIFSAWISLYQMDPAHRVQAAFFMFLLITAVTLIIAIYLLLRYRKPMYRKPAAASWPPLIVLWFSIIIPWALVVLLITTARLI